MVVLQPPHFGDQVRGGRRWDDNPPEQVEYTAPDIEALVEAFKNLEAGLFNLRRRIERRRDAARVGILACLLLRAANPPR
jgi:hypothetical protein